MLFVRSGAIAAVVLPLAIGCSSPRAQTETVAATAENRLTVIEHVTPRRDSVGGVPPRFEWTAVANADSYTIGVWSEVDQMVWRQPHLTKALVEVPKDFDLEPGTYYWRVTALREDRPVGDSGLSAFVVMPQQ
jgi:hypothetical protein